MLNTTTWKMLKLHITACKTRSCSAWTFLHWNDPTSLRLKTISNQVVASLNLSWILRQLGNRLMVWKYIMQERNRRWDSALFVALVMKMQYMTRRLCPRQPWHLIFPQEQTHPPTFIPQCRLTNSPTICMWCITIRDPHPYERPIYQCFLVL